MKFKKICVYLALILAAAFFLVGCEGVKGGKDKSDDNGGWYYDGSDDDDDNGGETENKVVTVKTAIDDVLNADSYAFKIRNNDYCKYEEGNLYLKFDKVNSNYNIDLEIYYIIYGGKYYRAEVRNRNVAVVELKETDYFYYVNRDKFWLFQDSRYTIELYMRCLSRNLKAFAVNDGYGAYSLKSGALALVDNKLNDMVLSADKSGLKITAIYEKVTYNAEFTDINKTIIKIPQYVLSELS